MFHKWISKYVSFFVEEREAAVECVKSCFHFPGDRKTIEKDYLSFGHQEKTTAIPTSTESPTLDNDVKRHKFVQFRIRDTLLSSLFCDEKSGQQTELFEQLTHSEK